MRVFVAIGGWNYEGWDSPTGVFSNLETAHKALDDGYDAYDFRSIFVYETDETGFVVEEIDHQYRPKRVA